jgi:hypothetical protein
MGENIEDWRSLWTCERVSRTAVHKSGMTARVTRSPIDPSKGHISFENTATVDLSRWDLGELTEEAITLWLEGKF